MKKLPKRANMEKSRFFAKKISRKAIAIGITGKKSINFAD